MRKMITSDEEFEIGDIIEIKKKKNVFLYLVKWKGYSDDDNTWEPESNLVHLTNLKKKMENLKMNYLIKNNNITNHRKISKNYILSIPDDSNAKSKGIDSLITSNKTNKKAVSNKLENKSNLSLADNPLKKIEDDEDDDDVDDEDDEESVKKETHNNDNNLLNVEDVYSVRIKNRKMEFLASLKNASPQWLEESNIKRTGHLNIKVNDFKKYIRKKKIAKGNRIIIKNLHNVGDELYISVIHNINNKEIHSLYPSKVVEYIYPQELLNFLLSRLRYRTA